MMRSRLPRCLLVLLIFSLAGCRPESPKKRRPNIIIVTLDTFRADRLAPWGGARGLAPFLNAVCRESVVFRNAITPLGHTHPSHASLFTGLYPRSHGIERNNSPLAPRFTTLAETLRDAGYQTAAFVQSGNILSTGGLRQGFEIRFEDGRFHRGAEVNRAFKDFVESRRETQPLFCWLHYFETHSFESTSWSAAPANAIGGPLACGAPLRTLARFRHRPMPASPESRRQAINILYDGKIPVMDRLVREFFSEAAIQGLLQDAVVIITADHGTRLGEHEDDPHSDVVWEEVSHVPLIFWFPDRRQRVVETRVSLIDVFPTLLDLLDIEPAQPPDGRSILPAAEGKPLPTSIALTGALAPPLGERARPDRNLVAAYLGRYKLIMDLSGQAVYDLDADPGETKPLPLTSLPENLRRRPVRQAHTYQAKRRIPR